MGGVGTLSRILHDLAASGIGPIGDVQREQLGVFVRELVLWSGRIHLIGKANIRQNISDLIVDSWALFRFARKRGVLEAAEKGGRRRGTVAVADLGSGAGFPGIVWKIASPDIDLTLIERRDKTLRFLERVIAAMKVDGIRAMGGDAGGGEPRGAFDVVVSKAAGRIQVLAPIVARLLREGGSYVTVKGSGWRNEVDRATGISLRLTIAERLSTGRGTVLVFERVEGREQE